MNTTVIILLCAVLLVMVALEVSVLLRETKRHGRRCGARKSARRQARGRNLKRRWRTVVLEWRRDMEPRPALNDIGAAERHFADVPEWRRPELFRMIEEAVAHARKAAGDPLRRVRRREWRWLRDRGLLSLGFQAVHELKGEER